jgi:GNAT superfamily N-acetyltransferase
LVANDTRAADQANSGASTQVVKVQDEHIDVLTGFIREIWDSNADAEAVRRARKAAAAQNPAAAGEPPPTFLLISSDRAIGHVSTIPIRIWDGEAQRPIHWVKGLMVTPDHRNGPVGFLLLKEAVRELGDGMAMVVEPPARRLFEALGYQDAGVLPNHMRVLKPGRFLSRIDVEAIGLAGLPSWTNGAVRLAQRSGLARLLGMAISGATGAWTAVAGRRSSGLQNKPVRRISEIDSSAIDDLWARVRSQLRAAAVRDSAYLNWRYDDNAYRPVAVYAESELAGVGIVRAPSDDGDPRLRGVRVAVLSDLLYPPDRPDIGLALLAAAENAGRELGADALLISVSHPGTQRLFKRRAFLRIPGNVHFLFKGTPDTPSLPSGIDEWWLSRGDSSADEVF